MDAGAGVCGQPAGEGGIVVDGALVDGFRLIHGCWEAKDEDDDLRAEVERMFSAGYRRDNILFQTPRQWDCG